MDKREFYLTQLKNNISWMSDLKSEIRLSLIESLVLQLAAKANNITLGEESKCYNDRIESLMKEALDSVVDKMIAKEE